MRRSVALILVATLPFGLLAQQVEPAPDSTDYNKGYAEGQQDGQKVNQTKWFRSGACCGCLGGGSAFSVAPADSPSVIPEGSHEFQVGYVEGYRYATKTKKQQNARTGAIAGGILLCAILVVGFVVVMEGVGAGMGK